MKEHVVLAPGLWLPGAVMELLASRLAKRGYAVHIFAYRGRGAFEANVEHLARFARESLNGYPAHFVGHSLGGVLMLEMLNRHPEVQAGATVLLGAPVRGCLAGRRLGAAALGRWMLGACRSLWDERPARWTRAAPLGVVAGTLPLGLGRALGGLPGLNDGVVCVEETSVDGMAERALVRQGHSMLILSRQVGALVERFLAAGRFA
jgi:pimeloyl-ACP methyl ester carboxylesterase